MSKAQGTNVPKVKSKLDKQFSEAEKIDNSKKSKLMGKQTVAIVSQNSKSMNLNPRKLHSNAERKLMEKGELYANNSVARAFKRVWNKEQRKLKGNNSNNATVLQVTDLAGSSAVEVPLSKTKVGVNKTTKQRLPIKGGKSIDTTSNVHLVSNIGKDGAKKRGTTPIRNRRTVTDNEFVDHDGVLVGVNDSDDEFQNEEVDDNPVLGTHDVDSSDTESDSDQTND